MVRTTPIAALLCGLALAGCGGEPDLIRMSSGNDGPDEFSILPNRPLEQPSNFAELPPPTPGGANRSDQTPLDDAVVALGGRPDARQGLQGPALVEYTTRFGVNQTIRAELAAEDRAFRERNRGRFFERVFNTNTYFSAYERQELDQYRELERLRADGVRTPAAPPEGVE